MPISPPRSQPIQPGTPVRDLQPGELQISDKPLAVTTILGSCVALTLFHSASRHGAVCHGLLPEVGRRAIRPLGSNVPNDCFRYMDCAIGHMLDHFRNLNVPLSALEAKLFGGADMFEFGHAERTIGAQNVDVAKDLIQKWNLRLRATDVGGRSGRRLIFLTHTGEAFVKRLTKSDPTAIANLKFDNVPGWPHSGRS